MFDAIILGAGASGLACALAAAQAGRRVAVLDRGRGPGAKVRLAGGGKLNFTNTSVAASDYRCPNPHFVKSALARVSPWELVGLVQELGLGFEEREHGRLFLRSGAELFAARLAGRVEAAGGRFVYGAEVRSAGRVQGGFCVRSAKGEFRGRALVLALGSPAWPQCGASDAGARLARGFGLALTPFAPALVPLLAPPELAGMCARLAGNAVEATLHAGGRSVSDALLFTHRGFSGPAALTASLWWEPGQAVRVDLLPGGGLEEALGANARKEVGNALGMALPSGVARELAALASVSGRVGDLRGEEMQRLARTVHELSFVPAGTAGMRRAEAAKGGMDVAGISSKTMQAEAVPGLFVTGELLDVTGRLGGYNIHWALASGRCAGESL